MLRLEHLHKRFACIFKCITEHVGMLDGWKDRKKVQKLRDSTLIFSPSTPSYHVCALICKKKWEKELYMVWKSRSNKVYFRSI